MKNFALILATFGSADEKILSGTIGELENEISAAFPNLKICTAFTSNFMIKKAAQAEKIFPTIEGAVKNFRAEGFEKIFVLPTHFTAGEEFDNKIKIHESGGVKIISPLFSLDCDKKFDEKIFEVVRECFKPNPDEDLILIGHGSPHRHNPVYENFQRLIDGRGEKIHVGVVEETDTPNFPQVVERLKSFGAKKILLAPLLFNGGVHVQKEIAGEEKNSWLTKLRGLGFEVRVCAEGLGTFKKFRALYLEKIGREIFV